MTKQNNSITNTINYQLVTGILVKYVGNAKEYIGIPHTQRRELTKSGFELCTHIINNADNLEDTLQKAQNGSLDISEADKLSRILLGQNIHGKAVSLSKQGRIEELFEYINEKSRNNFEIKKRQPKSRFVGDKVISDTYTQEDRIQNMEAQLKCHGIREPKIVEIFQNEARERGGLNYNRIGESIRNLEKHFGNDIIGTLCYAKKQFLENDEIKKKKKVKNTRESVYNLFLRLVKQSCKKTDRAMEIINSHGMELQDIRDLDKLRDSEEKLIEYCENYQHQFD